MFASLLSSNGLLSLVASNGGSTNASAIATMTAHITQKSITLFPFRFQKRAVLPPGGVLPSTKAIRKLTRSAVSRSETATAAQRTIKQRGQTRASRWLDQPADRRE